MSTFGRQPCVQSCQYLLGIADDRHLRLVVPPDHLGVDVDVHDPRRERHLPVLRVRALEARSDGDQQIGISAQRSHPFVPGKVPDAERITLGDRTSAVGARDHSCLQGMGQGGQLAGSSGGRHATPRPDQWTPRCHDGGDGIFECAGVNDRQVGQGLLYQSLLDALQQLPIACRILQVDRDLQRCRSLSVRQRRPHRVAEPGHDLGGGRCHGAPLADRSEHGRLVRHLVDEAASLAEETTVDLPRDVQDRAGRRPRLDERAHGVGGARSCRRDANAEPSGCTRVAIGGSGSTLLVADRHRADPPAPPQGVVDGEIVHARDAEHDIHPPSLETLDDEISAGQLLHGRSSRFQHASLPDLPSAPFRPQHPLYHL